MRKRYVLGAVLLVIAIIVMVLFLYPFTVDPGADKMPDDVSGPGEEGMAATGTPSTAAAVPEARPSPGEVKVTQ